MKIKIFVDGFYDQEIKFVKKASVEFVAEESE